MISRRKQQLRVMAVASGGGHWVQLLRLTPAFTGYELVFVTANELYRAQVPDARFHRVNDASRWNRIGLIRMAIRLCWIIAKEMPDVVISTGAAPGYFALLFARLIGSRTIWLDSIANVDRMSLSGRKVRRFADLWLTQWPHLARDTGPHFVGAVL